MVMFHTRKWLNLLFYQTKIIISPVHIFILVCIPFFTLWLSLQYHDIARDWYFIFGEMLIPPIASALFVPLILQDRGKGVLPFIYFSIYPLYFIFLIRFLLTALYVVFILLIPLFGVLMSEGNNLPYFEQIERPTPELLSFIEPSHSSLVMVLISLTPILFLAGLGLLGAHLTIDVRFGYLFIFLVWFITRATNILDDWPVFWLINTSVYRFGTGDWITPKIVQFISGVILLIVSMLLLRRSERLFL